MFCVVCGNEMANTAKFCSSCGVEIAPIAQAGLANHEGELPSAKSSANVPWVIGSALALLLAGGAGWWNGWFGNRVDGELPAVNEFASASGVGEGQSATATSSAQNNMAAAAVGTNIVGTWELIAEQCCGDAALSGDLPWEPIATGKRERVTFLRDGSFVSSASNNPRGRWSMAGGSIDGWLVYSVGAQIQGETLIVTHVPTSVQNAYSQKWRRVPGDIVSGPVANFRLTETEGPSTGASCTLALDRGLKRVVGGMDYESLGEWFVGLNGQRKRFTEVKTTNGQWVIKDGDGWEITIRKGKTLESGEDPPFALNEVVLTVKHSNISENHDAYLHCMDG